MVAHKVHVSGLVAAAALSIVAATAIALGIVFASGLGMVDAAGQPLGVPAVLVTPELVTPEPSSSTDPIANPTNGPSTVSTPTPDDGDQLEIVPGPAPVTMELDDHGGDNTGNSGSGGDNRGSGRSGH